MNLKKVILSDASTEAKVSAIAILLDKELPKLAEKVDTVKKLKGDQGERGVKGDKGDKGSDGKDGKDGRNGTDGSSGKNGKDGKDGVSVIDAKIDFDGSLVMKLSSNKEINVGEVVPSNLQEKIKLVTSGGAGTVLPNQAGNSGKVLGTDGTTLSWIANGGGGGGSGTVTSVAASVPTGLSVGGSPITTSGTLAITYATGYSIPTTSSQTNWDTAYTDRLKWDGGSTGLNAATARTSLGLVIGTNVLAPNGSAANLTSFPTFNQNTTGSAGSVANALTAGTNITFSTGTTYDGSTAITINASSGGGSGSAAANAGIAINENVYSTTYNTLISDSLTVPNTVGGIAAGTTASSLKSKNIVEIIDDLLFPTTLPTYTIPTISFTASVSGNQEIGSTVSQVLNQTHNKNDAGAYTSLVFKRGGTAINTVSSPIGTSITNIAAQFGYADPNNPNLSYSSSFTNSGYVVPAGSTTWTAEGTYGAGSAKQNNKGATDSRTAAVRSVNAPQAASTLASSSLGITGIYPYFWGVSTSQPTASDIATAIQGGTANKVLADAANNIIITFAASGQYVWFVTVATAASKTTWYNTALNNGSIGAGQFILAPVTQNVTSPQGYWSAVSFKVYISGYATTTSGSITFS